MDHFKASIDNSEYVTNLDNDDQNDTHNSFLMDAVHHLNEIQHSNPYRTINKDVTNSQQTDIFTEFIQSINKL